MCNFGTKFGTLQSSGSNAKVLRDQWAQTHARKVKEEIMTRRGTKKALRKAEEALRNGQYQEAAAIYDAMLASFDEEFPSLLDHAAVIWGKVQAANGLDDEVGATKLAESAVYLLSVHTLLEATAA